MQTILKGLMAATAAATLSGCLASTMVDVATAPVRMASKAADLATTSQSEADEKRGRELRKREERLGRLERDHRRHNEQCANGDGEACAMARTEHDAIQELLPSVPVEHD